MVLDAVSEPKVAARVVFALIPVRDATLVRGSWTRAGRDDHE
jgi:hypothetical protein